MQREVKTHDNYQHNESPPDDNQKETKFGKIYKEAKLNKNKTPPNI